MNFGRSLWEVCNSVKCLLLFLIMCSHTDNFIFIKIFYFIQSTNNFFFFLYLKVRSKEFLAGLN